MDRTLYFHDLQPAPPPGAEGGVSDPPELREEASRRSAMWIMQEDMSNLEPIPVCVFMVERPGTNRQERYGVMIRRDLLHGEPIENAESIARTMPDGWHLRWSAHMI